MIYKIINKYNITLGIYFFNNLNLFTYNIFNFFFKKIISDNKSLYLKGFVNNGAQKISKIPENYIDDLNKLLSLQEKNITKNFKKAHIEDASYSFEMTKEIQEKIFDVLQGPLNELINQLRKYYQTDLVLSDAAITRNYNSNVTTEKFSNYFHCDSYICTLVKIFINLHDVSINHGPFRHISKKNANKILKNNKINLNRIPEIKEHHMINHNTGKKGDVFLCNTTELIHAAGIPSKGYCRDMLFLEICALPLQNKDFEISGNILKREFPKKYFTKIISKPTGIKNLVKLFFNHLKL